MYVKKGYNPWNKGLKGVQKHSKETREKIKKNHKGTLGKHWKLSDISKHNMALPKIGKKYSDITKEKHRKIAKTWIGEKGQNWKGDNVGYAGMHLWVKRERGNPEFCEHCGKIGRKIGRKWNLDWANINHLYKRIKEDYISLCPKCHRIYDNKNNS